MKKGASVLCIMIMLFSALCGCTPAEEPEGPEKRPLRIVAATFPIYDWVRNILGDEREDVELTLLMDSGVDLHSYQPSPKDIRTMLTCDLFIYVGGESDSWARDLMTEQSDQDMAVISLMDVLGDRAREEEEVEGMQEERGEEEDGPAYDEHVWLSLKNAAVFCDSITDALAKLDPEHAESYRRNEAAYKEKLTALDAAYRKAVDEASEKTLLFADRFPFRYLTEDYGLNYFAAFSGCSAEAEASVSTLVFLAEKADELDLPCVLTLEGSDHRLAETIVQNTAARDLKILTMDSMQGITAEDIEGGATYLSIMENDLTVLRQALQGPAKKEADPSVDVDLTVLSSDLTFSRVADLLATAEESRGKTVKLSGMFNAYYIESSGHLYLACEMPDLSCGCMQGLEFELGEGASYPEDYPSIGEIITVRGTYDTYERDGSLYGILRNAELE